MIVVCLFVIYYNWFKAVTLLGFFLVCFCACPNYYTSFLSFISRRISGGEIAFVLLGYATELLLCPAKWSVLCLSCPRYCARYYSTHKCTFHPLNKKRKTKHPTILFFFHSLLHKHVPHHKSERGTACLFSVIWDKLWRERTKQARSEEMGKDAQPQAKPYKVRLGGLEVFLSFPIS